MLFWSGGVPNMAQRRPGALSHSFSLSVCISVGVIKPLSNLHHRNVCVYNCFSPLIFCRFAMTFMTFNYMKWIGFEICGKTCNNREEKFSIVRIHTERERRVVINALSQTVCSFIRLLDTHRLCWNEFLLRYLLTVLAVHVSECVNFSFSIWLCVMMMPTPPPPTTVTTHQRMWWHHCRAQKSSFTSQWRKWSGGGDKNMLQVHLIVLNVQKFSFGSAWFDSSRDTDHNAIS